MYVHVEYVVIKYIRMCMDAVELPYTVTYLQYHISLAGLIKFEIFLKHAVHTYVSAYAVFQHLIIQSQVPLQISDRDM